LLPKKKEKKKREIGGKKKFLAERVDSRLPPGWRDQVLKKNRLNPHCGRKKTLKREGLSKKG